MSHRALAPCLIAQLTLAGCAAPGPQVRVPTQSVERAWQGAAAPLAPTQARVVRGAPASEAPVPLMSPPDIRLAYIKPWTDAAGNRHFGSWVAIPVDAPKWVGPDGVREPMDNTLPQGAPAPRPR